MGSPSVDEVRRAAVVMHFLLSWVTVERERAESMTSVGSERELLAMSSYGKHLPGSDEKTRRLVDWNVEMLLGIMRQMVAYRGSRSNRLHKRLSSLSLQSEDSQSESKVSATPLEEVKEIIRLPEFNVKSSRARMDPQAVEIPSTIIGQLHHLVSKIASLYHNNPFHNFGKKNPVQPIPSPIVFGYLIDCCLPFACRPRLPCGSIRHQGEQKDWPYCVYLLLFLKLTHLMPANQLMSRIVEPTDLLEGSDNRSSHFAATLHDHSFGITSDPLTQFACAFSALIHDVDHYGVSNVQLVKEQDPLAQKYQRSVAEQNSLDLSWNLLMQDSYEELRSFLFPNSNDQTRFRQLVVNSVMATVSDGNGL